MKLQSKKDKNKSKKAKDDLNEFGLSRGIDFQNVSNVINFDFPTFDNQYVHRAGRTARAGTKGINNIGGTTLECIILSLVDRH